MDELDAMGIHYYIQYTLNDYEEEGFEPPTTRSQTAHSSQIELRLDISPRARRSPKDELGNDILWEEDSSSSTNYWYIGNGSGFHPS